MINISRASTKTSFNPASLTAAGQSFGHVLKESATTGTLVAGKTYYLATDGAWTLADADSSVSATALIGVATGTSPTENGLVTSGYVNVTGYVSNHSPGLPVYLSTTEGTLDTSIPTGTGDIVRCVGYCTKTTNVICFEADKSFIELA